MWAVYGYIEEPSFFFQIKGKDVILEVVFVAAGMDCIADNDKFCKKVKCLCKVGGIVGEKLALPIREKNASLFSCLILLSFKNRRTKQSN